jgi:hypothetical protein
MGDVRKQVGAHFVGDIAENREIDGARVSTCPHRNQFGALAFSHFKHVFVVDKARFKVDAVLHKVVHFARKIDRRAVGEMPTMTEIHAEDLVARIQKGEVDGGVGLCPRVWLYVGVGRTKELFDAIACEVFDLVDPFTATVVTVARVAFGVFVGQH